MIGDKVAQDYTPLVVEGTHEECWLVWPKNESVVFTPTLKSRTLYLSHDHNFRGWGKWNFFYQEKGLNTIEFQIPRVLKKLLKRQEFFTQGEFEAWQRQGLIDLLQENRGWGISC